MRKLFFTLIFAILSALLPAQQFAGYTKRTTLYETYQPAEITLYNGQVIQQKEANIFLRNGRLLFKSGRHDMEANMAQVRSVRFADRHFVSIDTTLAMVVDTIGSSRILCTTTIDLEAYSQLKINERLISNIHLEWDMINAVSSRELPDSDVQYPLISHFYVEIDGKVVKVDERTLRRMLPKDKHSRFDFYLQMPGFDWTSRESLTLILELFED